MKIAAYAGLEWSTPETVHGGSVEAHTGAVADFAEVQEPVVSIAGRGVKFQSIASGAGEAFGFSICGFGPGDEAGKGEAGGKFRAAFDEFYVPGAGELLRRAGWFCVGPSGGG